VLGVPVAVGDDDPEEAATAEAELFRLAALGDPARCDELVRRYRPIADAAARRFGGRGVPHDDLFQVACIGLLKAIRRFDPDRGRPFRVFAAATMRGELLRHFRDHTWMLRVPRRIKDLSVTLTRLSAELHDGTGRPPTVLELAEVAGADVDQVVEALDARRAYLAGPLTTGSDEGAGNEPTGPVDDIDALEVRLFLDSHVEQLTGHQRRLLHLRFVEDLTQTEIAGLLDTSQVNVSRQLAATLKLLRSRLHGGGRGDGGAHR
jgi:RNA polymerase sigma-B factor